MTHFWKAMRSAGPPDRHRAARIAAYVLILSAAALVLAVELLGVRFQFSGTSRWLLLGGVAGCLAFEVTLEGTRFWRRQRQPPPEQANGHVPARGERALQAAAGLLFAGAASAIVYLRLTQLMPRSYAALMAGLSGLILLGLFAFIWEWQPEPAQPVSADRVRVVEKSASGTARIAASLDLPRSSLFWAVLGVALAAFLILAHVRVATSARLTTGLAVLLLPGYLLATILRGRDDCDGVVVLCEALFLTVATVPLILSSATSLGLPFTGVTVALVVAVLALGLAAWLCRGTLMSVTSKVRARREHAAIIATRGQRDANLPVKHMEAGDDEQP